MGNDSKILIAVFLGTGEKIGTRHKFGIGHEYIMALLDAKMEHAPDIDGNEYMPQPIIKEYSEQLFIVQANNIAEVTLNKSNEYIVPSPVTHFGVNFTECDLLVMYGVNPDIYTNIFHQERIQREVLAKAHAMANTYFEQILACSSEEQINLFVYGFSRGGCIAMQAVNILYAKLHRYDEANQSALLEKIKVDIFLLDPVPGNEAIDRDPITHTIPKFVHKIKVIYSEYECRYGFHPLREFYKQSDQTIVEIVTFPCDHVTIKRRDAIDERQNAPAAAVTYLLTQHYAEVTGISLHLPVYLNGSLCSLPRRIWPELNKTFRYNEQEKIFYKNLAKIKQKKFYGILSGLFYKERKIRNVETVIDAYVTWPTILQKLENECNTNIENNKYLSLITQLKELLKQGHKAFSVENSMLIYLNFQDCLTGLTLILHNEQNSVDFNKGYVLLKEKLEHIKSHAVHDNIFVKIVMIALAILVTICTLGIAGLFFYKDRSHNYFSLQAKTAYLSDCVIIDINKHTSQYDALSKLTASEPIYRTEESLNVTCLA